MFKLVNKVDKIDYCDDDGSVRVFETPQEAKLTADWLNHWSKVWAVKPFADGDKLWREREQKRFDNGEYERVHADIEQHCLPDHFVHVSKDNHMKIAYTKNEIKGMSNVQSQISVKGYLEQYTKLKTAEINKLNYEHIQRTIDLELNWAYTPEDIVGVYMNFDSSISALCSCMTHSIDYYDSKIHPVSVYGNSDLSLAYLKNDKDETIARTLVYTKKKIYTRVYGSSESSQQIHFLLKSQGYKKSYGYYNGEYDGEYDESEGNLSHYKQSFIGATVPAIQHKHSKLSYIYVMPYLDEVCYAELVKIKGEDKLMFCEEETELYCQCSNGLTLDSDYISYNESLVYCSKCETDVDAEETKPVVTTYGYNDWCNCCVSNNSFFCSGTDEYYDNSAYTMVLDTHGNKYEKSYVDKHSIECDECNNIYWEETTSFSEINGKMICEHCEEHINDEKE